jgi:antitoxin component YwqK of YwqJK toxin-antitoxin module
MLLASAAHAVQDCELDGQRVNPANGNTTAGKSGLMRCKDRDTGVITREQQLQNGRFMGLARFYEKGKLAKENNINERGNMDGRAREFSPTGQVLREAVYDDGRETGLVRNFYPGGALRRAAFYAEPGGERAAVEFTPSGRLASLRCGDKPMLAPAADDARLCGFADGPSNVELFDSKGTLRSRLSFAAGKRVRSEDFYDNGKLASQDEVVGNQRTERTFSSEGIKRREVVSTLNERGAIKQREQEFSERGTLVRDQRWNAAGEPLGDDSFYLNGQPRTKAIYREGGDARAVDITEFHDNGQRASIGRFLAVDRYRRIAVGTHQRFNDKGVLMAESSYDDKGRVTRERTWDENGKPQRDDEVFEDGSRR